MADLQTTTLGKSGLTVTKLSAGGHFTNGPTGHEDIERRVKELNHMIDCGINYFDVQWEPEEIATAEVMKTRKDEMIVAWPLHGITQLGGDLKAQYVIDYCHEQQRKYGIEYVDIILWVALEMQDSCQDKVMDELRLAFDTLKSEGFCDHLAFSCHHSPQMAVDVIETFDDFSVMMTPYGPFLPGAEKLLEIANAKNVGTVTMKPFGGGDGLLDTIYAGTTGKAELDKWKGSAAPFVAAIKWVLQNPHLHCTVPGAHSIEQIDQIVAAAKEPLTDDDREVLDSIGRLITGKDRLGIRADSLKHFA